MAVVFAVKMVRRGGERAERFLLAGVSLMLANSLISSAMAGLTPWLVFKLSEIGNKPVSIAQLFSAIAIGRSCISLAGIV